MPLVFNHLSNTTINFYPHYTTDDYICKLFFPYNLFVAYLTLIVKVAKFPFMKEIIEFDFSFQPSLDKTKIMNLMTSRFVGKAENVIFCSTPRVVKLILQYQSACKLQNTGTAFIL